MANTITLQTIWDTETHAGGFWFLESTDNDNVTEAVVLDRSALSGSFAQLSIIRMSCWSTRKNVQMLFEFHRSTNIPIAAFKTADGADGGGAAGVYGFDLRGTDGYADSGSGGTGDIVLTTLGLDANVYLGGFFECLKVPS